MALNMLANKKIHDKEGTRIRLLLAALKCFGHRDYDAVSTREIVDLAEANISAISYHFGGKQGLYLATVDFLAERIQDKLQPLIEDIDQRLADADREACCQMMSELVGGLAHNLLSGELSEDAAGLIFREQNHPTEAFDYLYDKFMLPVQDCCSRIIAKALGSDPKSQETMFLSHSLIGQIAIFRMGRETILRRMGKKHFSAEDVKQIADLVISNSLKAMAPSRTGNPI
jgi:TetR/AcrR family transcriptional regulator, regulator of cefoperazone and chloramphenicol sensitivity